MSHSPLAYPEGFSCRGQLISSGLVRRLQHPAPSRAEIDVCLEKTDPGFLCLYHDVFGAVPWELEAHWGTHDHMAWRGGHTTVQPKPSGPT